MEPSEAPSGTVIAWHSLERPDMQTWHIDEFLTNSMREALKQNPGAFIFPYKPEHIWVLIKS